MPDSGTLEERLAAVERALTGDRPVTDLEDAARVDERLDDLEERVAAVEERLAELEAAVEAVRGYVGAVKSVNDEIERRADAALAKAEAVERAMADRPEPTGAGERTTDDRSDPSVDAPATDARRRSWLADRPIGAQAVGAAGGAAADGGAPEDGAGNGRRRPMDESTGTRGRRQSTDGAAGNDETHRRRTDDAEGLAALLDRLRGAL